MSNRDPFSSKPFSPSNDPFAPTSDDPLATTPGRTDVPLTEPLDPANDASLQDKAGDMVGKAQEKAGQAQAKAGEVAGKAQEKAGEVGDKAQEKADSGLTTAATGLGKASDMLRQQGEQRQGTVGTAATKTADSLENASLYLQEKDTDQLMTDLEALVRQKPVESVLVAAGIGFVLSKIFS